MNKSSTEQFKVFEIFNANTVDGTYTPFSMALILFLETSAFIDNSCWVKPQDFLSCSKLFKSFEWFLPIIIPFHIFQRHQLILYQYLDRGILQSLFRFQLIQPKHQHLLVYFQMHNIPKGIDQSQQKLWWLRFYDNLFKGVIYYDNWRVSSSWLFCFYSLKATPEA